MYDKNRELPDIDVLNGQPVNIRSKEMLELLGVSFDTKSLYLVQLALWGIDNYYVDLDEALSEMLRAMLFWKPTRLLNFFAEGPLPQISIANWEKAKTPIELARTIVKTIEERSYIHFPYYFSFD